jgi:ABC-type cobalamin/Fe3+-siderophores transport system ATPase subunit
MESPATDLVVEAHDLLVRRGNRTVINGLSLSLPRGVIMGLIGPNGAGKTSLVSAICGFVKPAAGTISVLGADMGKISSSALSRLRRRIGLLPQLSEINELAPLTVRDVVSIGRASLCGPGRRLAPADREAVSDALSVFGLLDLADKIYHQLSGGEKRKVHLARAFAQGPELLLLDEPMANLDVTWQERLRQEIDRLWARTGMTIIMVAHETHHLPESCTRIALLSQGQVIADGTPEQVLQNAILTKAYGPGIKVLQHLGRTYSLGG